MKLHPAPAKAMVMSHIHEEALIPFFITLIVRPTGGDEQYSKAHAGIQTTGNNNHHFE
jgi:hypothetical protein